MNNPAKSNELLTTIRDEITQIDEQLIQLFLRRMECSKKIGMIKKENKIEVYDNEREKSIYKKLEIRTADMYEYSEKLYNCIISLSKEIQSKI